MEFLFIENNQERIQREYMEMNNLLRKHNSWQNWTLRYQEKKKDPREKSEGIITGKNNQ